MPFVHFCHFHHNKALVDSNPHKSGLLSQAAQKLLKSEFLSAEQDVLQSIQVLLTVLQFTAEPAQSFTQTANSGQPLNHQNRQHTQLRTAQKISVIDALQQIAKCKIHRNPLQQRFILLV